ncbi:hypothetical protein [Paraclostridium sordellii]|uniref:Cap15 family cyclic dinucleotide receptor domain-containing protein n=1 Tax=Paraclostridium sordellii TaxID=1505 RepID=UPI0005DF6872|nr:hypothetical protein [Paeniclostridium sordellii]MCR1849169.1 hypothetical protein [Paeniclostridium sordellii]CEO21883.1 Uncharacterised protein [[Clostridium] sordellii] [Paeniclostridium sordellii]
MRKYLIDTEIRKTIIVKMVTFSVLLSIGLALLINPLGINLMPLNITVSSFFTFASKVISLSAIIFTVVDFIFKKYLWKINLIKKFHKVPDLNGKWEGQFISSFIDENTGKGKIGSCEMTVKQDWDKIHFKCKFNETYSNSINVSFNLNSIGGVSISFDYENSGSKENLNAKAHLGFNMLKYLEDEDTLDGIYFTDMNRKSQGTLNVRRLINNQSVQEA